MNRFYHKSLSIFYLLLIVSSDILCVHHWRISDDGKKIEAVSDSPYTLAYPGSLTDFIRQNELVKEYGKSYATLQQVLKSITEREKTDDPHIEDKVREKEESCKKANKIKLDEYIDNPGIYAVELCPNLLESYKDYTAFVREYFGAPPFDDFGKAPLCKNWFDLKRVKTSITGLPKLNLKLQASPEGDFFDIVPAYFKLSSNINGKIYMNFLNTLLSHSEERVSQNPLLYMATAAFLRSKGMSSDAYDCYQAGLMILETQLDRGNFDNDPGKYELTKMAITLNAITLLYRDGHHEESKRLVEKLIANDKNTYPCIRALMLATLADLLMVSSPAEALSMHEDFQQTQQISLSDPRQSITFEKAVKFYKAALKGLQETAFKRDSDEFRKLNKCFEVKITLLECYITLTNVLENQKENLDRLVNEKLHYNEVFDKQMKVEEEIGRMIAPYSVRENLRLTYEAQKYGWNQYRKCTITLGKRYLRSENPNSFMPTIYCTVQKWNAYENALLPARKATLKSRPPLNDSVWRVAEVFTRDRNFDKRMEAMTGAGASSPHFQERYPLDSYAHRANNVWHRADWPNVVDCQSASTNDLFKRSNFPQLFPSPENKGYMISDFLTTFLALDISEEHPLPWYEPKCDHIGPDIYDQFLIFDSARAIFKLNEASPKYAEPRLKTVLVRLAGRLMDESEVGQRILTAMKYKIYPRWVIQNLAALYWRVQGNPKQAFLCLADGIVDNPNKGDIAFMQMAQIFVKFGHKTYLDDAMKALTIAAGINSEEPYLYYLMGRVLLLQGNIDVGIWRLKSALDREPSDPNIADDLLNVACSGKSSRPAIPFRYPTVCCSLVVQNAVCIRARPSDPEICYVVDVEDAYPNGRLIYNRCNGIYEGVSVKTAPYAEIISPFLPVFKTIERDDLPPVAEDIAGNLQYVETDELPLDYGGVKQFFAQRSPDWWTRAKHDIRYRLPEEELRKDFWEEEVESSLAHIPEKPLSFMWVKSKESMLDFDVKLPIHLPHPTRLMIDKGLQAFPPPKVTNSLCNGVNKLSFYLENGLSTWISVTAKGLDIEKYVDLNGPMPGIANLQPVCPNVDKEGSPILAMDHLPVYALSDQFLYYKPEKLLTDALKSLGNNRDSIEHVAARLHIALMYHGAGPNSQKANWLLCVLSSLYWRVIGDAPKAVSCLRCALQSAPPNMRDVALVSLANICHQTGLLHSALIIASQALSISKNIVGIHFSIANIYASIGDYQLALEFYYSTLALQKNFEPAKERIRAIMCHSGQTFNLNNP